ncbi:uncharacterized protein Lhr [Drosophila bipectinata]|uniref:uncharacterized protein Lhr n=1 Tax=Drosophila bipectinata TaxID=42026 RepID=UPI001C8A12EB|nr:uncharacterized protein LOC108120085 [Drosophila bipectinata]
MSGETGALGSVDNPMILNIATRNADSQVVLNDVLLLEQICKYPFLVNCEDADYKAWGWNEVAKSFNVAYRDDPFTSRFSVQELQWRWEILKPFVPTLVNAQGDVPEPLWPLVDKINKYLSSASGNDEPKTKCQQLILSKLPSLKKLSKSMLRRLEVEVLDVILQHELLANATQEFGPKEQNTVENEYSEFLKAIRVKELPNDTLYSLIPKVESSDPDYIKGSEVEKYKMELVITKVFSTNEELPSTSKAIKREPFESPVRSVKLKQSPASSSGSSPYKKVFQQTQFSPRFVPVKSAKYYIKPLRVRVRRLDLDDYISLAAMRRYSRHSQKE